MMAVILRFYFCISLDWVYISNTRLKIIFLSQYRQFSFSVFSSLFFWCNIFCQADSLSIVFWKYKATCIFFPLDTFSLSIMPFHSGCRSSGFPGGSVGNICLQCRRHGRCKLDPWVGKIPWRGKWQPILAFLPGKSHGYATIHGGHRLGHNWGAE